MDSDFIPIQFDRSHLHELQQKTILPSFNSPLQTLDFMVLLLNAAYIAFIIIFYLIKRKKKPNQHSIEFEKPQKVNTFPFFYLSKHQRKGKSRDLKQAKDPKDHGLLQFQCQKCKYITEVSEKNFITNPDRA